MVGHEHQAHCCEGSSVQKHNVVQRRVDIPAVQGFEEMLKLVLLFWVVLKHSLASMDSDVVISGKSKEDEAIEEHKARVQCIAK